jgi:DNA recombination-dependent growth factor C
VRKDEAILRLQKQLKKTNDDLNKAVQDINNQVAAQEFKDNQIQDLEAQLMNSPVEVSASSFAAETTIAELRETIGRLNIQLVSNSIQF